jgi:L-asparaginase II
MNQGDIGDAGLRRSKSDHPDGTRSAVRMLQAISAASIGSGTDEELESAARELVFELREANEPPEQVLLFIKGILAQAGLRPSHPPAGSSIVTARHASIYRSVIDSSIRHYFQQPGVEHGGTA